MSEDHGIDESIFDGLQALADSAFPKQCPSCEKTYETVEEFIAETEKVSGKHSGLKEGRSIERNKIVEVFRNCPCGSTLMDYFNNRRDLSEKGLIRREKFGILVTKLYNLGLDKNIARKELLKVLNGDKSKIIDQYTQKKEQTK